MDRTSYQDCRVSEKGVPRPSDVGYSVDRRDSTRGVRVGRVQCGDLKSRGTRCLKGYPVFPDSFSFLHRTTTSVFVDVVGVSFGALRCLGV